MFGTSDTPIPSGSFKNYEHHGYYGDIAIEHIQRGGMIHASDLNPGFVT
jgi:hypothetical protein